MASSMNLKLTLAHALQAPTYPNNPHIMYLRPTEWDQWEKDNLVMGKWIKTHEYKSGM
jgi:hypothetical protein